MDPNLWPFLHHGMYSVPRAPGSTIVLYRYRVVDEAGRDSVLAGADVGLQPYRFHGLLADVAADAPRDPATGEPPEELLLRLTRRAADGRWDRAELLRRTYRIGEEGLRDVEPAWRPVREWSLDPSSGGGGP